VRVSAAAGEKPDQESDSLRYNTYYEQPGYILGGGVSPSVKYLLIACAGSFIVDGMLRMAAGSSLWVTVFGLTPQLVNERFFLWQFVTYIFVHGSLWHLLFNMFALWMFGSELERTWGSREFLIFFFITGAGAGLLYWIFASDWSLPIRAGLPGQALIGSSGAIFGLLAAYGLLFPERQILFMLIFPLKAKYFVLILAAIEFWLSWTPSGIAHFAHLSGMLIGYLYLKKEWQFTRLAAAWHDRKRRRQIRLVTREIEQEKNEQDEVNRILDKINAQGIHSLSRSEKNILDRASTRRSGK